MERIEYDDYFFEEGGGGVEGVEGEEKGMVNMEEEREFI